MSLSRRALFPAAAGGIMAMPEAAKAAMQMVKQATPQHPGIPPSYYGGGIGEAAQGDPNWKARKVTSLLEQKKRVERWVRGEFEEGELDTDEPDPRYRRFATTEQEIVGLKSVSAAHKVRMAEVVAQRRYREFRKKSAGDYLSKIIQELAAL